MSLRHSTRSADRVADAPLAAERHDVARLYDSASQDGMIVLPCGELQDCGDVVCFEIRIVRQDLFPRRTRSEELEHVLHTDAEAPNTRAATAHIRRHRDSIQGTHISSKLTGTVTPIVALLTTAIVEGLTSEFGEEQYGF